MNNDNFSQTTKLNYFDRIKNSFGMAGLGIILFLVSFVLLWWNEGNSVKVYTGLKEGKSSVVEVKDKPVDKSNNEKLVYINGKATSSDKVMDPTTGVFSKGLLLERKVEMYQWKENVKEESKEHVGGSEEITKTYSYERVWSDQTINSSEFERKAGHENPSEMPIKSEKFVDTNAKLGDFKLNQPILDKINFKKEVAPTGFSFDRSPEASVNGNYIYTKTAPNPEMSDPNVERTQQAENSMSNNPPLSEASKENPSTTEFPTRTLINPNDPEIGTMRISYSVIPEGDISVVAKQQNENLVTYKTKANTNILMASAGTVSSNDMFKTAENENKTLTWILRLLGFVLMWAGLTYVLNIISIFFAFLPFLKDVSSFIVSIVALVSAITLSTLTIAIAWLFYRPLLSIGLFIGGITIALALKFLVIDKLKKKQLQPAMAMPGVEAIQAQNFGAQATNEAIGLNTNNPQSNQTTPNPVTSQPEQNPLALGQNNSLQQTQPIQQDQSSQTIASQSQPQANATQTQPQADSLQTQPQPAINPVTDQNQTPSSQTAINGNVQTGEINNNQISGQPENNQIVGGQAGPNDQNQPKL